MAKDSKFQKPLIEELQGLINKVDSYYGESDSLKTENYMIFSVADPHKEGLGKTLRYYALKDKLRLEPKHQIIEIRLPLSYREYSDKKREFLNGLGGYDKFRIDALRKRDKLTGLVRLKILKDIVYGQDISVAFYTSLSGSNHLEIVYSLNPKKGLRKVRNGLEKLLA